MTLSAQKRETNQAYVRREMCRRRQDFVTDYRHHETDGWDILSAQRDSARDQFLQDFAIEDQEREQRYQETNEELEKHRELRRQRFQEMYEESRKTWNKNADELRGARIQSARVSLISLISSFFLPLQRSQVVSCVLLVILVIATFHI